jgi:Holliday junction DNA helicase RuvA
MIGRLRGELLETANGLITVEVGGVGYEISVPESVWMQLPKVGEPVDLRTRQVFREDGVTLYGFTNNWQRRLFDMLTGVKGCGPKIALSLIGQLGEEPLAAAILSQDAKALARANGVGPRLGERIILELKEKIAEENLGRMIERTESEFGAVVAMDSSDEIVEALIGLGYKRFVAETAARDARTKGGTVEEQLVDAIRTLRK